MVKRIVFLIPLIAVSSLIGCKSKEKNYQPGDPLTVTSIEMADEYGDSTLIQFGSYDILVDSGSEEDATHVKEVLTSKVSDKTIDLLVVTHPHGDHIGGIINSALDTFSIKHIVDYGYTYNTDGHDKITNSEYVQRYVDKRNSFINKGTTYHGIKEQMKESEVLDIDKDNDLAIRWLKNNYYYGQDEAFPNSNCPSTNPNTTSVSFVLEYKYWNIVMCGDSDSSLAESSFTANHEKLFESKKKRTLLKGTHHCSSSSMGSNFMNWCHPEIIFNSSAMIDSVCVPNQVSLGSGEGQLNHPNKSTVRRVKQNCEKFYWNGINGDITFVTDGVNDMTMSGAGRHKDYYIKDTDQIASRDEEKNINFFDSKFYAYFK